MRLGELIWVKPARINSYTTTIPFFAIYLQVLSNRPFPQYGTMCQIISPFEGIKIIQLDQIETIEDLESKL